MKQSHITNPVHYEFPLFFWLRLCHQLSVFDSQSHLLLFSCPFYRFSLFAPANERPPPLPTCISFYFNPQPVLLFLRFQGLSSNVIQGSNAKVYHGSFYLPGSLRIALSFSLSRSVLVFQSSLRGERGFLSTFPSSGPLCSGPFSPLYWQGVARRAQSLSLSLSLLGLRQQREYREPFLNECMNISNVRFQPTIHLPGHLLSHRFPFSRHSSMIPRGETTLYTHAR